MRINRKTARKAAQTASLLAAVAAVSHSYVAYATIKDWTGTGFTGSYGNPLNWLLGQVAGPGDTARFIAGTSLYQGPYFGAGTITVSDMIISGQSAVGDWFFTGAASGENFKTTAGIQITDAVSAAHPVFEGLDVYSPFTTIGNNCSLKIQSSMTYTSDINLVGSATLTEISGNTIHGRINHAGTGVINAFGLVVAEGLSISNGGELLMHDLSYLILNQNSVINNGSLNLGSTASMSFAFDSTLEVLGTGRMNFLGSHALGNGARLRIAGGGDVFGNSFIDLGNGNTGTLIVDGAGSTIQASSSISDWGAGTAGSATVTFSNSGVGTYSTLRIGQSQGSAQVALLSSSQLTTTTGFAMGSAGNHGTLVFNVNGGTLQNNGTSSFQNGSKVNLTHGAINLNGDATFGPGSTLSWSGGNVNIASGKTLTLDGGIVNRTIGSGSLSNGATLRIINSATAGGQFNTDSYFDIANGSGAITGTLSVSGVGSRFNSTAGLTDYGRNPGNFATVSFSNTGVGTYAGGLRVAENGGKALVTLSSGGQLNVGGASGLLTGNGSIASSAATINISGGSLNSLTTANFRGGTVINLSSGALNLTGDSTFATGASLNQTGGSLGIPSGKTLAFDGGTGTLSGSTGLPTGSTLRITNAGHFDVNGFFDVATVGTLLVDGAGSRITTAGGTPSDWGINAGHSATITFSNSGAGTYTGLQMSANGGKTLANISSSARLTTGSLLTGGGAANVTVNVSGGTLNSTGTANFRNGTTVNYSAGSIGIGGMLTTEGNAQVLLTTGGNKVLRVGGLDMQGTGKIDLNDNDMIVGALTPRSTIVDMVRTGRNGGLWNGPGIISTAAKARVPKNTTLGVLSGAEYSSVGGNGTFSGQAYTAADTLVKYTWYGDTDFNGLVDFDDYSRIDSGFNGNRTGWLNGDVDSNGIVDFDDYSLVDLAFNTQSGTLRRAMQFLDGGGQNGGDMNGPELRMVVEHFNQFGQPYANAFLAAVPEPTTAVLAVTFGALSLLRRRRRH
ncbi:MAG: hypothetical protein H7Z14_07380 [Anaerolineae bacterium]|nr:hypothetical protein [Phycisphaerae bacterium]